MARYTVHPDPVGSVLRRTRPDAICIATEPDITQKWWHKRNHQLDLV